MHSPPESFESSPPLEAGGDVRGAGKPLTAALSVPGPVLTRIGIIKQEPDEGLVLVPVQAWKLRAILLLTEKLRPARGRHARPPRESGREAEMGSGEERASCEDVKRLPLPGSGPVEAVRFRPTLQRRCFCGEMHRRTTAVSFGLRSPQRLTKSGVAGTVEP